jgi:hypothetical protein
VTVPGILNSPKSVGWSHQIALELLTDGSGFQLMVEAFEGSEAEIKQFFRSSSASGLSISSSMSPSWLTRE